MCGNGCCQGKVHACVLSEWEVDWGQTLALCPSYNDAQVCKRLFKSAREIVRVCEWVMNSCYTFACIALYCYLWPPFPSSPFQCILGFVLCGSRPKGDVWALQWGQGLPWLCKWHAEPATTMWNYLFLTICIRDRYVHTSYHYQQGPKEHLGLQFKVWCFRDLMYDRRFSIEIVCVITYLEFVDAVVCWDIHIFSRTAPHGGQRSGSAMKHPPRSW